MNKPLVIVSIKLPLQKASTSRYIHLSKNPAALISLSVVFCGMFALSSESVEAKTSRNSSHRDLNYLVPPPPPYMPSTLPSTLPSTFPSALEMTSAQTLAAYADYAVVEKPVNPYGKYIITRKQGDRRQVVQPNPYASYDPVVETKIQKDIDSFDSEISSHEKEIGKLLNL